MAQNAHKCQTSAKDHGSTRVSETLHPRLCQNCQTNCGAHKEKHPVRMDRRTMTSTQNSHSESHNSTSTGVPQSGMTIQDGSGCICLCSRGNPIPNGRSGMETRCGLLFQGTEPGRTQL